MTGALILGACWLVIVALLRARGLASADMLLGWGIVALLAVASTRLIAPIADRLRFASKYAMRQTVLGYALMLAATALEIAAWVALVFAPALGVLALQCLA